MSQLYMLNTMTILCYGIRNRYISFDICKNNNNKIDQNNLMYDLSKTPLDNLDKT